MDNLDAIRRRLNQIISDAATDLETREAAVASATEQLRESACWRQAQAEARVWFQQLIATQMMHLGPHSSTRMVLGHLARLVEQEGER